MVFALIAEPLDEACNILIR